MEIVIVNASKDKEVGDVLKLNKIYSKIYL